jgi:DNA-binding response OmpR family regulator
MAKILVVDDEDVLRELIADELRDLEYDVIEAQDGVVALDLIQKTKPDLVISDINMPNMNGIELFQALQDDIPKVAAIPFVFLTARADRENVIQGKLLGVDDYLPKPVDYELLVATVHARLNSVMRTDMAITDRLKDLYVEIQQNGDGRNNSETPSLDDFLEQYLYYARKAKQVLPGAALLEHAAYSFRTTEEAETIAFSLASVCPEPETSSVGIAELLINAVEHGNLGIGYEEKSKRLKDNNHSAEIERRLELPEFSNRKASVEFHREKARLVFVIKDQGDGFDWQDYIEFDPARLTHKHGRGIAMALALSFTSLEYRGKGNEVFAVIDLDSNLKKKGVK